MGLTVWHNCHIVDRNSNSKDVVESSVAIMGDVAGRYFPYDVIGAFVSLDGRIPNADVGCLYPCTT